MKWRDLYFLWRGAIAHPEEIAVARVGRGDTTGAYSSGLLQEAADSTLERPCSLHQHWLSSFVFV